MSVFKSEITLRNPVHPKLDSITVSALVETGALHLCLPEHIALQLELEELEKREVTLADGRKHLAPYMGPIEVSFDRERLPSRVLREISGRQVFFCGTIAAR